MAFLINQNIAFLLIVAAVMLTLTIILYPRSVLPKTGMVLCLAAAGFELFNLQANFGALLAVALSPLPFFLATYRSSPRRLLLMLTTVMLIFGSVFLFTDQNDRPTINMGLILLVAIFCAQYIMIAAERRMITQSARRGDKPASFIGTIGKALVVIHETGLVQIEEETWPARSDQFIPAGSDVRIIKQEGMVLIVKKVEKLTRD